MPQYSQKTMDLFMNPKNVGSMDETSPRVGTGVSGSAVCGDVMKVQIEIGDDRRIADAKFKTFGCGAAIAASSLATEWLKGKTLEEAATLDNQTIANDLQLPPVKIHCSVLAHEAVLAAIDDWKKKHGLPVQPHEKAHSHEEHCAG
ncbi:MAG: iron-sulfur cluster assembly scaffold protein [Planctomycetota bacterium]|nr:iron-sulfur cluster assembly scaffold protein [Planctomycetota bacterium]